MSEETQQPEAGSPRVILLGPQRFDPTVGNAIRRFQLDGFVSVITTGWQEREGEVRELGTHLDYPSENLELHRRSDEVFEKDPDFWDAYRNRQIQLRQLQNLYRLRLDHLLSATRSLMANKNMPKRLLGPEQIDAVDSIRRLDERHLLRLRDIHQEFDETYKPLEHPEIARHREELRDIIARSSAVVITGGHVLVLLNRLKMFGLNDLVGDKPILAWSAGSMVLADKIVLFHDSPPQGPGNAEVVDSGLGIFSGLLPLPHASKRLRLNDEARVSIFARRFRDSACVAMDPNTQVTFDGENFTGAPGTLVLTTDGTLEEMGCR